MAENPFGDDPTPRDKSNPFADDEPRAVDDGGDVDDDDEGGVTKLNPFGEAVYDDPVAEGAGRMEEAARRIRLLKSRLGGEGLTPSATRELLVELGKALDSAARALRYLGEK